MDVAHPPRVSADANASAPFQPVFLEADTQHLTTGLEEANLNQVQAQANRPPVARALPPMKPRGEASMWQNERLPRCKNVKALTQPPTLERRLQS